VPYPNPGRVAGLDGLRGLSAVYVLVFHCRLLTISGFPRDSGPFWLGWLMYGRLAVVFFLVLSGFSLALGPAAAGSRMTSVATFARRRARRILPAYWAALVFSVVVALTIVPASHYGPPTVRTVLVYTAMLQDVVVAPTPNGAFWSIAVEAELYLIFPLLILIRRRFGLLALLAAGLVPIPFMSPAEGVNRLAPHLLPVFVIGIAGAGTTTGILWRWLAPVAALPVVALIVVKGSAWTVDHYFWIDVAAAPAMLFLIRARFPRLLLDSRPMRKLGSFSYSLYLTHLPIVMVVCRKVAQPLVHSQVAAFGVTLAVSLPLSIAFAWLFAAVFERRSQSSTGSAVRPRMSLLGRQRGSKPSASRSPGNRPGSRVKAIWPSKRASGAPRQ